MKKSISKVPAACRTFTRPRRCSDVVPFLRYCSGTFARPKKAVFHDIPKVRGVCPCCNLAAACPWLTDAPRFRAPSKALRACSRMASCQKFRHAWWLHYVKELSFSESPGRTPLLSRLRTQPVPLWASLMLLMQRYSEYFKLPNLFASFFKEIFKLSYKALKHKYLHS